MRGKVTDKIVVCRMCKKKFSQLRFSDRISKYTGKKVRYFWIDKKQRYCSKKCYHNFYKGKKQTGERLKKSQQSVKLAIRARTSNPEVRAGWISKMKEVQTGSKNSVWVKDRSLLANQDERGSYTYAKWRRSVHLRDNFKCRMKDENCNGRIEVHHILSWKKHPDLRYKINNGITLCHAHHPRVRSKEKRLASFFKKLVSVSN